MRCHHHHAVLLTGLLGAAACSKSPAPVTRPSTSTATTPMRAGVSRLTTQWQSRVVLEQRDSLVLTLPNGTRQVQRLGRQARFTLTVANGNFTVRLDSLQLAPASEDVSREAVGTSWTGKLGAFGRLEALSASKGGILVEELTTVVAALLPTLPRGGAMTGEVWADTTKRTIRVEIFRAEDRRIARWRANPATEIQGLRLVPIQLREEFEQIGRGVSSGREMNMTAQGSRTGAYFLTPDGRVERVVLVDSITKLITIPSSRQSIPTMQYSRTQISYFPLVTRNRND
jgi:hypothetical protein